MLTMRSYGMKFSGQNIMYLCLSITVIVHGEDDEEKVGIIIIAIMFEAYASISVCLLRYIRASEQGHV
jgi:hypothetical protein